jgi:hypothetical protein
MGFSVFILLLSFFSYPSTHAGIKDFILEHRQKNSKKEEDYSDFLKKASESPKNFFEAFPEYFFLELNSKLTSPLPKNSDSSLFLIGNPTLSQLEFSLNEQNQAIPYFNSFYYNGSNDPLHDWARLTLSLCFEPSNTSFDCKSIILKSKKTYLNTILSENLPTLLSAERNYWVDQQKEKIEDSNFIKKIREGRELFSPYWEPYETLQNPLFSYFKTRLIFSSTLYPEVTLIEETNLPPLFSDSKSLQTILQFHFPNEMKAQFMSFNNQTFLTRIIGEYKYVLENNPFEQKSSAAIHALAIIHRNMWLNNKKDLKKIAAQLDLRLDTKTVEILFKLYESLNLDYKSLHE